MGFATEADWQGFGAEEAEEKERPEKEKQGWTVEIDGADISIPESPEEKCKVCHTDPCLCYSGSGGTSSAAAGGGSAEGTPGGKVGQSPGGSGGASALAGIWFELDNNEQRSLRKTDLMLLFEKVIIFI
jgi:hypothetical protein